jgi:predicted ATP-grasp superfamily ATP-dependent carboligase
VLLDTEKNSMVRYSRYVVQKLDCPSPLQDESGFAEALLHIGRSADHKMVFIPTSDPEVLAVSGNLKELGEFFYLPTTHYEVINTLVNKILFYKLLESMGIPFPKTYYPTSAADLWNAPAHLEFPFILKPAYVHRFAIKYHCKAFMVNNEKDLAVAMEQLSGESLEMMAQEFIPGKDIYMFSTYFNRQSQPMAFCGCDKLRQSPPDIGSGSLCRSSWRALPIAITLQVLEALGYVGIAESEFKRDPRDGVHKFFEINARIITENSLLNRCGVEVAHMAYREFTGMPIEIQDKPVDGVLWIDDLRDIATCISQLKKRKLSLAEVLKPMRGPKVFSVAARDDYIPFLVYFTTFTLENIGRMIKRIFN